MNRIINKKLVFSTMNNKRKQNNFYLAIAFAILWVSFASIIQFHMDRIHGRSHLAGLEFLKTENKVSFKESSTLRFKIDLNSGILNNDVEEFCVHNYNFLVNKNFSPKLIQADLEVPNQRGPPLA